ncbi:transport and Golgi organization protein 1 homolog isoform X2 [Tamandua tetradactyla]|uniref:transport and Golgi organization protein 1 homolog isoform X2 n=1 Tax=Tamandua tetradactyla TaxID=48850 RepID=UPI004053AE49
MWSLGLLFWLLLVQSSWSMLGHPNASVRYFLRTFPVDLIQEGYELIIEKVDFLTNDHFRIGPDIYGFPMVSVNVAVFLGIISIVTFLRICIPDVGHRLYSGTVLQVQEEISEAMKFSIQEHKIIREKLSEYKDKIIKLKDDVGGLRRVKISLLEELNSYKNNNKMLNGIIKIISDVFEGMQVPSELKGGQNIKDQELADRAMPMFQHGLQGLAPNNCTLEEYIKKLQADSDTLHSENSALEEESNSLAINIEKLQMKLKLKERKKREYER